MLHFLLWGCIALPVFAALVVYFCKDEGARRITVMAGVGGTAVASALLAVQGSFFLPVSAESLLHPLIAVLDFALLLVILLLALRLKHKLCAGLAMAQIAGLAYLDFVLMQRDLPGQAEAPPVAFSADALSLVMVLVISLVGGAIVVYGLGYMKEHEEHLRLTRTRQPRFFFVLLVFLGAMNGLVLSDYLPWVFFFWEVTTLSSYLLISHDGNREARANALRALWMNMIGGTAFVVAMLMLQRSPGVLSVRELMALSSTPEVQSIILLPLAFLCLAGFTKAAQMPFQSWLCGAMVAPTPVSALLHSSTMVKAGVYLVLRLSPLFSDTVLSSAVSLIGFFTFLAASALACGQSNGKKILAYSTIANLGLIFGCAGVGTPAAITAAILLIIFHAVSKGLLFLCVGAIEQHIGSRDIESMRGLYQTMPRTALITVFGIMTMMLPPFGALLAKWMAIESLTPLTPYMPVLVTMMAAGSALTVLFWARWAGMLLCLNPAAPPPVSEHMESTVQGSLMFLTGTALVLSLLVPFVYLFIRTVVGEGYGGEVYDSAWGVFMNNRGAFAVYPLFVLLGIAVWAALRAAQKSVGQPPVLPYLSGIQMMEDGKVGYNGPMGDLIEPGMSNYYLDEWFGEQRLTRTLNTIALVLLVLMIGGVI